MLGIMQFLTRMLESANRHLSRSTPKHLLTGRRGEMEAYFYLRRLGYRMVATNVRVRESRGEIDIVGWDGGTLCFIEVKTRTRDGLTPPEAAVNFSKKQQILSVARRYVRGLSTTWRPHCRFDIVTIILGESGRTPHIELYKGAFDWDAGRPRERRHYFDRRDLGQRQ
jgi:putative endonuclease